MAFYQAWYPILNSKTAFFNIKKSLYSLGMIINLVLFFIPKRQEIYRLYLIKKRKKLAYMMLNSKMFSNNTTSVNTGDNIDDLKIGIYFFNGITILGTDRYGILLNFSSINGAVRCQIIYTTKNIRITRSYGGSTGWTDWETK